MALDFEILGKGIYSPRQAARLVGGTPQEVLRWTRGSGPTPPLWQAYYQEIEDTTELSFADLIEVRVVKALRKQGISLQAIRYAISFAQDKYGIERPLSSQDFKTDGAEILMNAVEKDGELVSLSKMRPGQKVFAKIIEPSLRDLEYENGLVAKWRPEKSKTIVVDPKRHFGEPILDRFGISTNNLYNEFKHFADVKYLAKIYEIPIDSVRKAIEFESSLDKRHDEGIV